MRKTLDLLNDLETTARYIATEVKHLRDNLTKLPPQEVKPFHQDLQNALETLRTIAYRLYHLSVLSTRDEDNSGPNLRKELGL